MGSSSSKVAKRTLKGQQAVVKAPKPSQQSIAEVEQQSLEQGMVNMSEKDAHMGALLDKLQGSISGRHIDIRHVKSSTCSRGGAVTIGGLSRLIHSVHDPAALDLLQESKVAVRESREQRDAGRLRMSSLRALLAEGAAGEAGGNAQRIDTLASKYGVDAETLGKVLRYTQPLELESEDASQ